MHSARCWRPATSPSSGWSIRVSASRTTLTKSSTISGNSKRRTSMSIIDLSDIPIIDHHAHALKKLTQPLTMSEYQGYFSESPDPIIKAKYVPDTIIWQWGIRTLANYLNCEPTAEAVLAARNALS